MLGLDALVELVVGDQTNMAWIGLSLPSHPRVVYVLERRLATFGATQDRVDIEQKLAIRRDDYVSKDGPSNVPCEGVQVASHDRIRPVSCAGVSTVWGTPPLERRCAVAAVQIPAVQSRIYSVFKLLVEGAEVERGFYPR